jgi:protein tyrosine phosphatase domain-containing protein 1
MYCENDSAINGLRCNFIGEEKLILASQRPSDSIIESFKIIEQFKKHNIYSIFNLQEKGEHPYCGDPLTPNGFSYNVETFTKNNINYYNFSWKDRTIPSIDIIENNILKMKEEINKGKKIAVHCHAGLGRTAILIACFFIFYYKISASKAISIVRKYRKGTFTIKSQIDFIFEFEEYIKK